MHSPHPSPSLRVLTHHLPRTSYFPPHPHPHHPHPNPQPRQAGISTQSQINHQPPQPLTGCLKHSNNISGGRIKNTLYTEVAVDGPFHSSMTSSTQKRPRPSFRLSAIPLSPQCYPTSPIGTQTQIHGRTAQMKNEVVETGWRRPSFKIDLPPRIAPDELIEGFTPSPAPPQVATSGYNKPSRAGCTPYAELPSSTIDLDLDLEDGDDTDIPHDNLIMIHQSVRGRVQTPEFFDYNLPSSLKNRVQTPGPGASTYHHQMMGSPATGYGSVGLGYSLNKRAPTPWIRDGSDQWVRDEDLEELELAGERMEGMTIV